MERIKTISLALAIVVVLNLFINYGVFTFYKGPKWENFCKEDLTKVQYVTQESCEAVGGRWFANNEPRPYYKVPQPAVVPPEGITYTGWCDVYAQCQKEFQAVEAVYKRNVFIVLIVAGLLALLMGFLAIKAVSVANGFLWGGLLSIIIGTMRYWSDMNDYLRFIILGVALALLIWLGYKKMSNRR